MHRPTFNQDKHHDIQHQDNCHQDKQAKQAKG